MPSNLAALPLNDPLVICRYKKMLDWVLPKLSSLDLVSFQVGNEIDFHADSYNVNFWSEYWDFYAAIKTYLATAHPTLKTSVIGSLKGAIGRTSHPLAQGGLQQLWALADRVIVTYYPIDANFAVENTSLIDQDISALVALYPNKPIILSEFGYQSGSVCSASSEAQQANAVQQLFSTWDKFANKIQAIMFLRLNDLTATPVPNCTGNNRFQEYLETLGLRQHNGALKAGWQQLLSEAQKRGW